MYSLLMRFMHWFGVFNFFKIINQKHFSILMYHGIRRDDDQTPLTEYQHMHVPLKQFKRQMAFLKKHYHVISMSRAMEILKNKETMPSNAMVITFDDGYLNNYTLAWPVCKALELPITIYAATDFINHQSILWPDRLMLAIAYTRKDNLTVQIGNEPCNFSLKTESDKDQAHLNLLKRLKAQNAMDIDAILDQLEKQLDIPFEQLSQEAVLPCQWEQLKEMADSGLVEIGAHTAGHHILTRLDETSARNEITQSKASIEAQLSRPCPHFAYPNGTTADFNARTEQWIREAGFESSVTTVEGFNDTNSNNLALNRFGIYGHYQLSAFLAMISGFHLWIVQKLKRSAG